MIGPSSLRADELIFEVEDFTIRIVEPRFRISDSSNFVGVGTRTSTYSKGKYPGLGRLYVRFYKISSWNFWNGKGGRSEMFTLLREKLDQEL